MTVDEIPQHWQWKSAEELCDYIQRGKQPEYSESGEVNIINQRCIYWDELKLENVRNLSEDQRPKWQEYRYLQNGDVLLNSTGVGTVGRAQIFEGSEEPYVVDGHVTVMRPDDEILDSKYLFYFLRSGVGQNQIEASGSTGQIELRKKDVLSLEIPVPPIEEQKEIVEEVDQLFERYHEIETSHTRASNIQEDLLFSIFLGGVKDANTRKVSTGEVIKDSQYGISKAMNEQGNGYPILRMGNYDEKGVMDYSEVKHVPLSDDDFEKYKLSEGDVLFNRTNSAELVGKCAIYDGELDDAVFASYLIRVYLDQEKVHPEYFVHYLNSPYGREEISKKAKQAVSQANINTTELSNMDMLLPPIEEQRKIVKNVSDVREQITTISKSCTRMEEILEALPKSILDRALKGELLGSTGSIESVGDSTDFRREQASLKDY